jgi:hypothetical protein
VKVDEIVLRGNTSVPRKRLLDAMQTKTSKFLSSQYFNEETLREDVVELRRVYRAEGYLDAEVVLEDLRFSDDKSEVVVTIAFTEGEQYTVGDVKFEVKRVESGPGSPPPDDRAYFTQETLRGLLASSRAPSTGQDRGAGAQARAEAYFERSYLEARVEKAELRPAPTAAAWT